jgi:hypothetical protein
VAGPAERAEEDGAVRRHGAQQVEPVEAGRHRRPGGGHGRGGDVQQRDRRGDAPAGRDTPRPPHDEGHPHAALPDLAFLALERGVVEALPVVAGEDEQRVRLRRRDDPAEGAVDALHGEGERGLQGVVDGRERHVEEQGLAPGRLRDAHRFCWPACR